MTVLVALPAGRACRPAGSQPPSLRKLREGASPIHARLRAGRLARPAALLSDDREATA